MSECDDRHMRGWCIDHALRRPRPITEYPTSKQIITEAKEYEDYLFNRGNALVIKITQPQKK